MNADVELWLYGSRARGDADAFSDTDVLAVGDVSADVDAALAGLDYPRINASAYSWDEIERMRVYGSLYLHHVAREGKRLVASAAAPHRLPALLADLPEFKRASEDMAGFQRALAESCASLEDGGWPEFECEVVATVARHAAILGSYCVGEPSFGRERPFFVIGHALGYNATRLNALVRPATAWRLHQPGSHAEDRAVRPWLRLVEGFLSDLQQVIDDHEAVLPHAA